MGAAGWKGKQSGRAGRRIRIERPSGSRSCPGGAPANQRRRLRVPERWGGAAPPRAVVCGVGAAAGAGPQHSPAAVSASPARPPAAAEPRSARPQRPGPASRHVGEHGGAAAPGHDQPVRAGRGLRGRPGEAAAAGGPLAVRDRPEHVLPRKQHSQRPPPPPDDVHPQQHACHASQLPRCPGHVLQASRLRGPAEQQPHDCGGLLTPCKLQPLLGLVPPQPPGALDAALVPQLLPPPPLPTAHVAPRTIAGGRPAESYDSNGWPEMRLGAAGRWGPSRVVGTQWRVGEGGSRGQGVS